MRRERDGRGTTRPADGPLSRTPWARLTAVVRGPDWARIALARRSAAAVLAVLAVVLMIVPDGTRDEVAVLVATRDLAPGATVHAPDLAVRSWPAPLVPSGALRGVRDADGRVLAGAVRSGEALTDLRLVGPQLAARARGPDAAAVPVRPADPGVAGLLAPGSVVDVVAPDPGRADAADGTGRGAVRVVAAGAVVLSVLPPATTGTGATARTTDGPLVLVALPPDVAAEVAAASLAGDLALTLR